MSKYCTFCDTADVENEIVETQKLSRKLMNSLVTNIR
jgi:hypothetical protein